MKINWNPIADLEDVRSIRKRSEEVDCLIFKHSTRCNISSIAKYRIETGWEEVEDKIEPFLLDLLAFRPVSSFIADEFSVHHESPQILIIRNGECIFDASHLDISIQEIQEATGFANV